MPFDVAHPPLRRSWILAALVSAVGLGLALELTQIHLRVHADPSTRSFCTLSEHVNCDKTAQSAYAVMMGVPTSVWGLLGYSLILLLALLGWRSRRLFVMLPFAALSLFCALSALALATLSIVLGNLCILCAGTWLVDFTLLLIAVRMLRGVGSRRVFADAREAWRSHRAGLVGAALVGAALIPLVRLVTPEAWGKPAGEKAPGKSRLADRARTGVDAHLQQGLDDAGHPYMGASKPKLTIIEFADYQCPHCTNAHAEMRELLAKHPGEIRIVHRHFPLDNQCNSLLQRPFHPHACTYAKMAACAALAGKFWPANDYLFEHGRDPEEISVAAFAQQIGADPQQLQACIDTAGADKIKVDIEEGLSLKMTGTPSFVVDGKLYPGRVPEEVLGEYAN
jgi:protein-disulfide isomerase/uncharacterized membrane protein